MPCSHGCCATNSVTAVGAFEGTELDFSVDRTSVAVDSEGRPHLAYAERDTAPIIYVEPDGAGWTRTLLDEGPFANDAGASLHAYAPALAISKTGGSDVVYLAYEIVMPGGPPTSRARFGVKREGTWTFEDLPDWPTALELGADREPLIVTSASRILRRVGSGWETIEPPELDVYRMTDVAIDARGDLVAVGLTIEGNGLVDGADTMTGSMFVSRWSTGSGWSTERVVSGLMLDDAKIGIAGEEIHVLFRPGSSGWGVRHARRSDSGWTIRDVTSDPIVQLAMAVEPCGAVHFAGYVQKTRVVRYYRSVGAAWRYTDLAGPACGGFGVDIALGSDRTYTSYLDCPFRLSSIPFE